MTQALLDATPPETEEEIEAAWVEEAIQRAGCLERGEEEALDGEVTRPMETRFDAFASAVRAIRNLDGDDSCDPDRPCV